MRAARGLTSKEHDSKSFTCAVCRITIVEKQCFHFPLNHFQVFPDIAFLAQAYPPCYFRLEGNMSTPASSAIAPTTRNKRMLPKVASFFQIRCRAGQQPPVPRSGGPVTKICSLQENRDKALQTLPVFLVEAGEAGAVQIEDAEQAFLFEQRDHDLRAGSPVARDVARECVDVRDDD